MSVIIVIGLIVTFEALMWFTVFNKWVAKRSIQAQQRHRQQRPYDWAKEPKTTEKITWRSGNVIHVKGWHDEHEA